MADDFLATTATSGMVSLNGSVTGSIEVNGDRDWFRTQLTGGERYRFELQGSATGNGSLSDPFLRLYNSTGVFVTSNDDGGPGFDSRLFFQPATTGIYFLEAAAFSDGGVGTYRLAETAPNVFAAPTLAINAFGASPAAGGWTSDNLYPRQVADVNGDGRGDIVGFGFAGVQVSLASIGPAGVTFGTPTVVLGSFGASASAGGWTNDTIFPRVLGDVNGDGRSDIVAFGFGGVQVSLATTNGNFAAPFGSINNFGQSAAAGGWIDDNTFHRAVADVSGDGRADIVGFGQAGTLVSLGLGNGQFANPTLAVTDFGQAQGWVSDDRFPRVLADVTGDGLADIVGFGQAGVIVARSLGGGLFAPAAFVLNDFGEISGWTSDNIYHREVRDVNGDGRADIVGFGQAGVLVALSTSTGGTVSFDTPTFELANFAVGAGGWTSQDLYPRHVADVTGDGSADIVGFGSAGVLVSQSDFFFV